MLVVAALREGDETKAMMYLNASWKGVKLIGASEMIWSRRKANQGVVSEINFLIGFSTVDLGHEIQYNAR